MSSLKPIAVAEASQGWTWLQDYVFATKEYTVACEKDRRCEVGTGVMLFGRPRGRVQRFTGATTLTTFGAGAIHVRVADSKGSCRVAVFEGEHSLVTILSTDW